MSVSALECSPQFTLVGENCLHVNVKAIYNWVEARNYCLRMGGHLATFKDRATFFEYAEHLKSAFGKSHNQWFP